MKRPSVLVVSLSEIHHSLEQIVSEFEDIRPNDLARQNGEPDFDLVEANEVSRGDGGMNALLLCNPSRGSHAAVRGPVARNDVSFLTGIGIQEQAKKADERHAIAAPDRLGPHPPSMDLQGPPAARRFHE